jgi:hypothetical protein
MEGIEMNKKMSLLCLFVLSAGCAQQAKSGLQWVGTWAEAGGKDAHGGELKCVARRVEGSQWKAHFTGYCNRQFAYDVEMTGTQKGERIVFSGDADLGQDDGKYTWTGEIVGGRFDGEYTSEKGKRGSFAMRPAKAGDGQQDGQGQSKLGCW